MKTINPKWKALENKPHLVPACALQYYYKPFNIGPPPKLMTKEELALFAAKLKEKRSL